MEIGCCYAVTPIWPKCAWAADACERLGHTVRRVHSRFDLPALSRALSECDLCIFGHKSLAGRWPTIRDAVRERKCPVVYWWFDLVATSPGVPIQHQPLFQQYKTQFTEYDVVLVKERELVPEYREQGVNAHWCDQGCPSDYPECGFGDRWDLLVWGQCGSAYRERMRAARAVLAAGFRVGWACLRPPGHGIEHVPWTHPDKLPELASQAKCVLSCGSRNEVEGYWSDRFWMALGMGACVVRRATPGLPDGPYQLYHTNEECVGAVRWAVENGKQAQEMGRRARQWVMRDHTIERRVEQLLALTAGTPDSRP